MIIIPFSFLPPALLKKTSRIFLWLGDTIGKGLKGMDQELVRADMKIKPAEYISMCLTSTFFLFIILSVVASMVLSKLKTSIIGGLIGVFIISLFIFSQQLMYPKLKSNKNIKNIERNLLPALQNMVVQLNSGVPLFNVMAAISDADYGGVSDQFKIAVKK